MRHPLSVRIAVMFFDWCRARRSAETEHPTLHLRRVHECLLDSATTTFFTMPHTPYLRAFRNTGRFLVVWHGAFNRDHVSQCALQMPEHICTLRDSRRADELCSAEKDNLQSQPNWLTSREVFAFCDNPLASAGRCSSLIGEMGSSYLPTRKLVTRTKYWTS